MDNNEEKRILSGKKVVTPNAGASVKDESVEAKERRNKEVRKKLQDAYKEPSVEIVDPVTGQVTVETEATVAANEFSKEVKKSSKKYGIVLWILFLLVVLVYVWLFMRGYVYYLLWPFMSLV